MVNLEPSLVIVVICISIAFLLIGSVVVWEIQEYIRKQKNLKINKGSYLVGIQQAEDYLAKNGLVAARSYCEQEIPINFKNETDKGFLDYVNYYKDVLNKLKLLDTSRTDDEVSKAIVLAKKINERKEYLSVWGFKEVHRG